ncbi:hypothetical protein MUP77_16220 [Candidatus Bathyarchaeota archaeon]|nr:hypothetical protein [Candidatus Bathyarchaeota archaeon]
MEVVKRKVELEEKLKSLEGEKSSLQDEVEALKMIPQLQTRVAVLEGEVAKLREERKRLQGYVKFTAE